jgi:hypothetical protein
VSTGTSGLELTLKAEANSLYLQFAPFTTPQTTIYPKFAIEITDSQGVQTDFSDNIKLSELSPRQMDFTVAAGDLTFGATSSLQVNVKPSGTCKLCAVVLTGPGLTSATCDGCEKIAFGLKMPVNLMDNKISSC